MDYIANGDLQRYLNQQRRPLSEGDTKTISFQVVEGLCYLHGEGFSHRDLKLSVSNRGPVSATMT